MNDDPRMLTLLGHAYAASGRRDEGLKMLTQLKEIAKQHYVQPYYFAVLYTGLGEKDQAFQWLERSYQERSDDMSLLAVEPLSILSARIRALPISCGELGCSGQRLGKSSE